MRLIALCFFTNGENVHPSDGFAMQRGENYFVSFLLKAQHIFVYAFRHRTHTFTWWNQILEVIFLVKIHTFQMSLLSKLGIAKQSSVVTFLYWKKEKKNGWKPEIQIGKSYRYDEHRYSEVTSIMKIAMKRRFKHELLQTPLYSMRKMWHLYSKKIEELKPHQ